MTLVMVPTTLILYSFVMAHLVALIRYPHIKQSPWWELSITNATALASITMTPAYAHQLPEPVGNLVVRLLHLTQLVLWLPQARALIFITVPTLMGANWPIPKGLFTPWQARHHAVAMTTSLTVMAVLAIAQAGLYAFLEK